MSFLRSMTNALSETVSDLVKKATSVGNPYEVQDFSSSNLARFSAVCNEDCVTLYKDGGNYFCIVYYPAVCTKAFSLFRVGSEHEAMTTFSNFSYKLQPLYLSSKKILTKEMLQQFCDILRQNPTWTTAHLAAWLGLTECFRHNLVTQHLSSPDETSQMTPIQVAIQQNHLESVQELIIMRVRLNLADNRGNNVFHYAASANNSTVIQYLASKEKECINQLNMSGESPLHVASCHDKPDNVEQLLRWGANPSLDMSGRFPIHCAMKIGSAKCVEVLCRWSRDQLHIQDKKYGGTPLHWAKSRECVYLLADLGCNLEAKNKAGETALHIMIQKNRVDCVMGLLTKGADTKAVGSSTASALQMAIQVDNADLVQALIVFGADINARNQMNQSPRHLAATNKLKNRDSILYFLHRVGAQRCPPGISGCNVGCAPGGTHDGLPRGKMVNTPEHQKQFYDTMVADVAMAAALTRSTSASGSSIMCEAMDSGSPVGSAGDRVLCLDGGGIRGLVLIQILLAIEKAVGQPIGTCFDWIGGTSTGGILALAIVQGKSTRYTQGLYFRLKDEVFKGKRPYDSEPLERFMKREFGETTRMSEKEYPRVLVTGVMGDRIPAELHMFRNYDPPGEDQFLMMNAGDAQFPLPPRPNDQLVWRAARSSGAAPSYFRAFGRFLDGGLMANNPTLDVLTEVHKYQMGLRVTRQTEMIRPLHVVLSLGTGRIPPKPVDAVDVYRPEGLFDVAKVAFGAKNLGGILIEQCTQAEGRPVERARAWCSMIGVPYFRLSPQLSEDIPLDCKDDATLINMLWETQCYIWDNQEKIAQLTSLLWP